jgi:type VI secretion system protein ImpG
LWPLSVAAARYQTTPFGREIPPPNEAAHAKAVVRIQLRAGGGMSLSNLEISKLRFYLGGEPALAHRMYELLFDHLVGVSLQAGGDKDSPRIDLGRRCLAPVGFGRDEGLLPYDRRSFLGYRLLTEYFAFPKKFMFFDLTGLERLNGAGFGEEAELCLFFDRAERAPEPRVGPENFRLGCAPIVNLFSMDEIRLPLSQTRAEYQVIADTRLHQQGAVEVYSIDNVQSTNVQTGETRVYQPFYSFKHETDPEAQAAYWLARRRPSLRRDDRGAEVYLSFVDLAFRPTEPAADVITLRATCTNRDLPAARLASGADWQFDLQEQAPLRDRGQGVITVDSPTAPIRLDNDRLRWRLISHLSLNHLSITDDQDGAQALREILRLYEFAESPTNVQHIEGIERVTSHRRVAPLGRDSQGPGFGRGVEIEIEFDHEKFAGASAFLFGCVLERFLGLSASLNSVTRLVANFRQPGGEMRKKEWEWRTGDQTVL